VEVGGIEVRRETIADRPGVRAVEVAAFGHDAEADLVQGLRLAARTYVGIVACEDLEVLGHAALTEVTLEPENGVRGLGLAPVAVMPDRQRSGIGSALVRSALDEARRSGAAFVVVLGEPAYYGRFGFRPASAFGLRSEYDEAGDAFQVIELAPGALRDVEGFVRFRPEFAGV
jgi:putative acetyltransferase